MSENFKEMNFASKLISDILADVSRIDDLSTKLLKLDFHVHQLEEELGKIEAFKRELPNCMHLLTDGIERLKEEKDVVYKNEGDGRAKMSIDFDEKKKWMSSIQLWSTPVHYENKDPVLHLRSGYGEGAFLPFKKEKEGLSFEKRDIEQQRKQRRCWCPELHKRFVDALHQLGGAQSATPKQIRELMKVDGLTNDEVKSHLQKYRIHVKKVETWAAVVGHSGSPQGPLHNGVGSVAKGGSSTGEEEDPPQI